MLNIDEYYSLQEDDVLLHWRDRVPRGQNRSVPLIDAYKQVEQAHALF